MGQKLVSVVFTSGSTPQLWSPGYSPRFRLEVSGSQGWQSQENYYINLTGSVLQDPVELGPTNTLTGNILKTFIRDKKRVSFLVDDEVSRWRVSVFENVLAPEGLYFPDESGGIFEQL